MKLYEKVRNIIRERGISIAQFHRMVENEFQDKTLSYRSFKRILSGASAINEAFLTQASFILSIPLSKLKEDTEEETQPVDYIPKNKRLGNFMFNSKAIAEILIKRNRKFQVIELILEPGGKTKLEQDPFEVADFEKYIYCLQGKIACFVGGQRYVLSAGDGLSFKSTLPHWFENLMKATKEGKKAKTRKPNVSRCIIFQDPRYI